LGHSDADVLTHAIMDALLGAAAMGDIGQHFPDTDDRYLGIDSQQLLSEVCRMIRSAGYEISNLDATVIAQQPKLMPYLSQMRQTLSVTMGIPLSSLNLKATTEERLGFTGRQEGIAAHCVCLIERK
jgi:2-C-methyl-D-erythritol 2,4-cyclodiphosphate synthase